MISDEIEQRVNLQNFWVASLQKYAQKINSSSVGEAAESFIKSHIEWTVEEVGIDCTIECLKKSKKFEPPFRSKDLMKSFLRKHGGTNAVIQYLEYMCLECGPTRAAINLNALLNRQKEDLKKGVEPEKQSI